MTSPRHFGLSRDIRVPSASAEESSEARLQTGPVWGAGEQEWGSRHRAELAAPGQGAEERRGVGLVGGGGRGGREEEVSRGKNHVLSKDNTHPVLC